jgi:hypothetical protein
MTAYEAELQLWGVCQVQAQCQRAAAIVPSTWRPNATAASRWKRENKSKVNRWQRKYRGSKEPSDAQLDQEAADWLANRPWPEQGARNE